jgi:hypothetical protein
MGGGGGGRRGGGEEVLLVQVKGAGAGGARNGGGAGLGGEIRVQSLEHVVRSPAEVSQNLKIRHKKEG